MIDGGRGGLGNVFGDQPASHFYNRGIVSGCDMTDAGGLNITWTGGILYDQANKVYVYIDAEATPQAVTNNTQNFLKWVSGETLTLSTTPPSGDEIGIAKVCAQDGDIVGYFEADNVGCREANLAFGLQQIFPVLVVSGMTVIEDVDVTNALDVTLNAGVFYAGCRVKYTVAQIDSRTTALRRHHHTGGVWDTTDNIEIETTNYDDGTNLAAIPANKYVKSIFYYSNSLINWVYPTSFHNTAAAAIAGPLPTIPPGLVACVPLTVLVYQQADAALPAFGSVQWIDARPIVGLG